MNVLVDTTVWSLALRRKPTELTPAERSNVEEHGELVREGRARMIGLIRQELLSGIKTREQFDKLRAALRAFPDEPLETSDHEAAAESSNRCREKGIVVSVVDILICSVAITRGWSVFTTDPDFQNYARVLPIELHTGRR